MFICFNFPPSKCIQSNPIPMEIYIYIYRYNTLDLVYTSQPRGVQYSYTPLKGLNK